VVALMRKAEGRNGVHTMQSKTSPKLGDAVQVYFPGIAL
jgi:hypothetical protein